MVSGWSRCGAQTSAVEVVDEEQGSMVKIVAEADEKVPAPTLVGRLILQAVDIRQAQKIGALGLPQGNCSYSRSGVGAPSSRKLFSKHDDDQVGLETACMLEAVALRTEEEDQLQGDDVASSPPPAALERRASRTCFLVLHGFHLLFWITLVLYVLNPSCIRTPLVALEVLVSDKVNSAADNIADSFVSGMGS